MSIDPRTLREGDIVHVRCRVIGTSYGLAVEANRNTGKTDINNADIVHVEPRPIAVGNRVRDTEIDLIGFVKAIEGGAAWVWPVRLLPYTAPVARLEHYPSDEAEAS